MTRKDYINIAAAIVATQERIKEHLADPASRSSVVKMQMDAQLRGVRRAAAHICNTLAADNPRFDPAQFLKACGYGANAAKVGATLHLDLAEEARIEELNAATHRRQERNGGQRRPICEGLEDEPDLSGMPRNRMS